LTRKIPDTAEAGILECFHSVAELCGIFHIRILPTPQKTALIDATPANLSKQALRRYENGENVKIVKFLQFALFNPSFPIPNRRAIIHPAFFRLLEWIAFCWVSGNIQPIS